MEDSILISTKKMLGIDHSYNVFDLDILTHINASFSILNQLGVGPLAGFLVEDSSVGWSDLDVSDRMLSLIKTYIFLKVRLLFDPPSTSYHISAAKDQISELEWRLNHYVEVESA